MIRYDISFDELVRRANRHDPKWIGDAKELTNKFKAAGKYLDHRAIWRRIVKLYMRIQYNKCAFCERKLEGEETGGTREFDVEHFRPKSSVKAWPPRKLSKQLPEDFPISKGSSKGYYLLPYHLYNYTVSCKPCNQSFKSNYFPVENSHSIDGEDPRKMKAEKPYLVYPLGSFDDDPEKVIRYEGVQAVPVAKSGRKQRRAAATIVFFGLNDRDEHFVERAEKVALLYLALKERNGAEPLSRKLASAAMKRLCSAKSSHTNCMRSFKRLYEQNKPRAEKMIEKITELLESSS